MRRHAFSICGMLLVTVLAGWINFEHFYDGPGNPSVLNVLMTALVVLFWMAYLIINRKSRGYLICSLCLTVGLLITLGMALAADTIGLPSALQTLALLLIIVFVPPLHGITGFYALWLLYVCEAALLLWLTIHGYFLYQLRGKKGGGDEKG